MSRRHHQETVLSTGWRIVGRDAESIAARAAQASLESMVPAANAEALYAVQVTVPAAIRGRPSVEVILDAITAAIQRTCPECPRLVRDEEVTQPATRLGGVRYTFQLDPGREWTGEVVWRAVHQTVPGAAITTHVIIEERSRLTTLTVRVTADDGRGSVRGYVGAGAAQPGFLRVIGAEMPLSWLGAPLVENVLHELEVESFVRDTLMGASRNIPVVVLAPNEDGTFVVDPVDLMWELLGRARLYVIHDHGITYRLSDALGDRRLSCYWGAARCYYPDFSLHDDPRDHPLLVADRLADPLMRATWLGEIGMWTAETVRMPRSIAATEAEEEKVSEEPSAPGTAAPQDMPPAAVPTDARDIDVILDEIRNLAGIVSSLANDVERLRTLSAVRSSSTSAIERRLARVEDLLLRQFGESAAAQSDDADEAAAASRDHEESDEGAASVRDVVQAAAETYSDWLAFLDSAYRSADESPYEDPERVSAIFGAMARLSRLRMEGNLGMSLRDAFSDFGIDYRSTIARGTPAKLREQYRFRQENGSLVEAEEHIVLGNTYDPRRCLRIYFSSRVPNESRFVIAHVGRHFEVKSTT